MVKRQEKREHEGYAVLHVRLDAKQQSPHPLLVKKSDSGADTLFVTHL